MNPTYPVHYFPTRNVRRCEQSPYKNRILVPYVKFCFHLLLLTWLIVRESSTACCPEYGSAHFRTFVNLRCER